MKEYSIISNASGTRSMVITEEHLNEIKDKHLLDNVIGSNGIINEDTLEHIKLFVSGMLDTANGEDSRLANFYKEVLNHPNMKPTALANLVELYSNWKKETEYNDEENSKECSIE